MGVPAAVLVETVIAAIERPSVVVPADWLLLPVGQPSYVRAARRRATARSAIVGSGGFSIETCLLYLAALGVFFATPPDTSQIVIVANSARPGLKKSGGTTAGDLTAA